MRQKLSSLVFNGPRAKTKTVLELSCKMDPKSSIIQSVVICWGILSLSTVQQQHTNRRKIWNMLNNLSITHATQHFLPVFTKKQSYCLHPLPHPLAPLCLHWLHSQRESVLTFKLCTLSPFIKFIRHKFWGRNVQLQYFGEMSLTY